MSAVVVAEPRAGLRAGVRRRRSIRRRVLNLVFTAALLAAAVVWMVALRPQAMGGPAGYVMVRGVSMEPTYHTGDLVIVHPAGSYGPGDIVAYRVPAGDVGAGALVIHRIIGGTADTGFDLLGDNNDTPDDWHPHGLDIVGTAWLVVPKAGTALMFLHDPLMMGSVAAAVAVALFVAAPPKPARKKPERAGA